MGRAAAVVVVVAWFSSTAAAEPMRLVRRSAYPDGGSGEKYVQTWNGLDVIGGQRFVRRDAAGRELWSSGRAAAVPERATPLLTAEGILAGLGRPELSAERHARLVVWAPPGRTARLAYQVVLPRELARMQTLRLMLDADTGRLLWMENLVKSDRQGQVFPSNPSASTLATVMLDLPAGAQTLENGEIQAINCVDQESCPLSREGTNFRFCESLPLAHADENGDFIYDRPASDTATEDAFSEVQMFYHATRGLDFFHGLGFLGLTEQPMMAMVNLRMPAFDTAACNGVRGTQTLQPLENALFMPAGAIAGIFPPGDAMVFGQGEEVDFAYDGDVVYHELTHAVAAVVTPMGTLAMDERGLDASMAAMHEGFADYFSSALAGDPRVAEYVGAAFSDDGDPLRDLENERSCATDLTGEEHEDSEMFSGALWAIRSGLAEAERTRFDAAMFVVLDSLGEVESFETVRAKVIAETGAQLGSGASDIATRAFADREFDVCAERIQPLEVGASKRVLYIIGSDDVGVRNALPAVLQFEVSLTNEAHEIRLDAARSIDGSVSGGGTARLGFLVKRGAPIVWDEDRIEHDAEQEATLEVGTVGDLRPAEGVATGNFPAGTYYVQITNAGTTWYLADIRITTDTQQTAAEDGCGCGVGTRSGGPPAVLWLLALVALRLSSARRAARRCR